MKLKLLLSTALILASVFSPACFAQQDTTVKKEKIFKNIVRYNITNPLIFGGKSMIFGYERVMGEHQSFSINFGQFTLPKLLPGTVMVGDSIELTGSTSQTGYNISADYRFYLAKENKYRAPRGVYIGPYYSHIHFKRTNNWKLDLTNYKGDVSTDFGIDINGLGFELGYQFIVWKRLAIDLVLIGPGIAKYEITTKLSTQLEVGDQEELFKRINDYLSEKIPGYSLVIDDEEYEKSGTTNTTTIGYRYMVHLGFFF
jgi:hypothetical protein